MTPTPTPDIVAALQLAALTLNRLARERSADASGSTRATTTLRIAADVAQSEADALQAGAQALAVLWRDARNALHPRDDGDDVRDDHLERACDAALRSRLPFTL
mgnify:FL=1